MDSSFTSTCNLQDVIQTLLFLEKEDEELEEEMEEEAMEDDQVEDEEIYLDPDEEFEDDDDDEGKPFHQGESPEAHLEEAESLPPEMFSSDILTFLLFRDSPLTLGDALKFVLKFCSENKVNEQGLQSLLLLLGKVLLPQDNLLPLTLHKLYKLIGLETEDFAQHLCINECWTFPQLPRSKWTAHFEDRCPTCKEKRFTTTGKSISPRKKFFFIPVRYLLRNLQAYPPFPISLAMMKDQVSKGLTPLDSIWGAKLMDGFLKKTGVAKFEETLALSVGMDGVDCFKHSSYSVIPVGTKLWNLHESTRTNWEFLLLNVLIPGGKKPKRYDGYLQPLIQEIKSVPKGGNFGLELITTEQDHVMLCDTTEHMGVMTTCNCTRCQIRAVPNPGFPPIPHRISTNSTLPI